MVEALILLGVPSQVKWALLTCAAAPWSVAQWDSTYSLRIGIHSSTWGQ